MAGNVLNALRLAESHHSHSFCQEGAMAGNVLNALRLSVIILMVMGLDVTGSTESGSSGKTLFKTIPSSVMLSRLQSITVLLLNIIIIECFITFS